MTVPPAAPFEQFFVRTETTTEQQISIDISADIFVIPTADSLILPSYNQYTVGRSLLPAGVNSIIGDTNINTGLYNQISPWVACYDSASSVIDFFLFTGRPNKIDITVAPDYVEYITADDFTYVSSDDLVYLVGDDVGRITQLTFYVTVINIYHGQITFFDLTLDSNSDLIPDVLSSDVLGSVAKFLESYGFPYEFYVTSDDYYYVSSDERTLECQI